MILDTDLIEIWKSNADYDGLPRIPIGILQANLKDATNAVEKLIAENLELRDDLTDMVMLILEHGSPTMKAHATRIGKALYILSDVYDERS